MSFWGPIIGAGLGAAASYFGGQQASDATKEANAQNAQLNRENMAMQKEFAQTGIRMKVADAHAAGIHPLYALGANTTSYNPSSIGMAPDTAMGEAMASMGQDISRAANTATTQDERHTKLLDLQLEGAQLDNDLKRTHVIQATKNLNPGPPLPGPTDQNFIPGQGNSGFKIKPAEATASASGNPAMQAGAVNDYGLTRTATGYAIVPSTDVKERIEDQFVPETAWAIRNQLLPALKGLTPPDPKQYPLPKGYTHWAWNPYHQEFQPAGKEKRGHRFSPATGYNFVP